MPGEWDPFLGLLERARAEAGAEQMALERKEFPGFAKVTHHQTLGYLQSVFNKKLYSQRRGLYWYSLLETVRNPQQSCPKVPQAERNTCESKVIQQLTAGLWRAHTTAARHVAPSPDEGAPLGKGSIFPGKE